MRRARVVRRRPRDRRSGAGRGLARAGHRRSPRRRRRARPVDLAALGRPRHLEHDGAALAAGRAIAHHLVDPSTGRRPTACGERSAWPPRSCLDANIASTAAIIRGDARRRGSRRSGCRAGWCASTARSATSPAGRRRATTCRVAERGPAVLGVVPERPSDEPRRRRDARAERLLVPRARHRRGRARAADRERRARDPRLGPVRGRRAGRGSRSTRVHRDLSLLVLVVLVIHIVTSVLDGFAPITPARRRDPVQLALPAAVARARHAVVRPAARDRRDQPVRRRLGYRAWRAIHWLAYASWPVAVLHGLGTGSDVKQWWMLALTAACIVAVLVAVWARIAHVSSDHAGLRAPATALAVITPDRAGDLHARRSAAARLGAPRRDAGARCFDAARRRRRLRARRPRAVRLRQAVARSAVSTARSRRRLSGHREASARRPEARSSTCPMRVSGQVRGRLRVRIAGEPVGGRRAVDDRQPGRPAWPACRRCSQGRIDSLQGTEFSARVRRQPGTRCVDLHVGAPDRQPEQHASPGRCRGRRRDALVAIGGHHGTAAPAGGARAGRRAR